MDTATYFAPFPGAFEAADPGLANFLKVPLGIRTRTPGEHGSESTIPFLKEFLLIDLREFPAALDTEKAIRDCELLRELLQSHPDQIEELVLRVKAAALGSGMPGRIQELLKEIGLTESAFAARGGGFLWLLIVLLAAGYGQVLPHVATNKAMEE